MEAIGHHLIDTGFGTPYPAKDFYRPKNRLLCRGERFESSFLSKELQMRLTEFLNDFLQDFYTCFAPPVQVEDQVTGSSFYESVIEQALRSPEFKARLLADPAAILSDMGIVLPAGMVIQFLENTQDTVHIVIPPYVGE